MQTRVQPRRLTLENRTRARGGRCGANSRRACRDNLRTCIELPQSLRKSRYRLGSFSQDPIGFTVGDANLYRYVGNGPTTLTDPSGLNPNQGGSKDRDDFMGELRNWEEIFRAKHGRYPNWHEGLLLMRNVQLMPVDAGSNHYYVFGCKNKRWLDMRHVVETAIGSAAIGDARSAEIGVLVEVIQKRVLDRGPHPLGSNGAGNAASANGVEDLFSNIAGLYLAEHGRRAGFTSRLSTVMDSFFDMMDVGDVSDSCSYGSLPATEIEWQRWRLNPWVFWTMQEEEGAMVGTPFLTPFLDGATTPGDRLRSNEQALDIDDLSRQPFPVPPVPKPSGTPRRR